MLNAMKVQCALGVFAKRTRLLLGASLTPKERTFVLHNAADRWDKGRPGEHAEIHWLGHLPLQRNMCPFTPCTNR